jgi:hypothetical protein
MNSVHRFSTSKSRNKYKLLTQKPDNVDKFHNFEITVNLQIYIFAMH